MTALESFIEETPAYTPSGFAAKIRRLAHGIEAGPRIDDEGNIDARCLRVLADNLARMIGAN